MEDTDECVPLSDLCKMDDGGRGGAVSRGEEPRFYRPYASDTKESDSHVPVIGGKNIDQFYLGDAPGDIEEYVDVDAIDADVDTDVSDNKLDAFKNKDKIAYRETAPELSFVVDAASGPTKFYNKTAYFLQLQNDGGLAEFSDSSDAMDPHYLAGLLNSDALDFYYKAYYEHLSFRHAPAIRCRPSHLHHAPIPVPDEETREAITGHSEAIHDAKRQLKTRQHDRETLFETFKEKDKTESFRTKVRSVVDSQDYNIGSFNVEQDGEEVSLNRFHTVRMHSEDAAEDLAEFLEEFGDEYIAGNELRNLELPEDFDEFRDAHSTVSSETSDLEDRIASEREALNDEVFALYGLEGYRDKIEEYLDSFLTVIQ